MAICYREKLIFLWAPCFLFREIKKEEKKIPSDFFSAAFHPTFKSRDRVRLFDDASRVESSTKCLQTNTFNFATSFRLYRSFAFVCEKKWSCSFAWYGNNDKSIRAIYQVSWRLKTRTDANAARARKTFASSWKCGFCSVWVVLSLWNLIRRVYSNCRKLVLVEKRFRGK